VEGSETKEAESKANGKDTEMINAEEEKVNLAVVHRCISDQVSQAALCLV